MPFVCLDNQISYTDSENFSVLERIPAGTYTLYSSKRGPFLQKTTSDFRNLKLYGKTEGIASHVVEAFEESKKTLGVLFSGDKGLGKSLTVSLIVEKLKKVYPVIFINSFDESFPDFLLKVENSVIVLDEFDKVFSGLINEDSEEGLGKQECLLSVLDGGVVNSKNLYLFTANKIELLDSNLIARPGRIKYHYKFKSLNKEQIEEYLLDTLNDKSKVEISVESLMNTRFVSYDILEAFVEEMNNFNVEVEDAVSYLNLNTEEDFVIDLLVKARLDGIDYEGTTASTFRLGSSTWENLCLRRSDGPYTDCVEDDALDIKVYIKYNQYIPCKGSIDYTKNCKVVVLGPRSLKSCKIENFSVTITENFYNSFKRGY